MGDPVIELQLSTKSMSKPLVVFDGNVIEFFYDDLNHGSRRVHVCHIKSIEIIPVSRGKEKYSLQIKGEYMLVVTDVSEEILSKAQELVAEIQRAMATLQL
jgi:hypothetical protein